MLDGGQARLVQLLENHARNASHPILFVLLMNLYRERRFIHEGNDPVDCDLQSEVLAM